jgi:hypothetical protein
MTVTEFSGPVDLARARSSTGLRGRPDGDRNLKEDITRIESHFIVDRNIELRRDAARARLASGSRAAGRARVRSSQARRIVRVSFPRPAQ